MIKDFFIRNKKLAIILIVIVMLTPVFVFVAYSIRGDIGEKSVSTLAPKPTLKPFPSEGIELNRLIIRYIDGFSPDDIQDEKRVKEMDVFLKRLGVVEQEKVYDSDDPKFRNTYSLIFDRGIDIEDAAEDIYSLPEIEHVEPSVEIGLF